MTHHHILIEGRDPSARPLVLLHGSAGSENDLLPFATEIAPPASVLALRGAEPWETGFAFFRRFADRTIDEANLTANALSLAALLSDAGTQYRFAKPPIAVGFSNGAIMAAALLLLRPNLLAGAILLRPLAPFAHGPTPDLTGVPTLLLDGAHDTRRAPGDGRRLAIHLSTAGADVEHHVLPAGHAVSANDLALMTNWLKRSR